jgi:pyridoxamine 5'-phosphate oxidase
MRTQQAIEDIRRDYKLRALDNSDLLADPIAMFRLWFDEATKSDATDVNAMSLATCGADAQPTARVVLLKGIEDNGFVFYTNYDSAKGHQIASNDRVGLCFYWPELERQVRIDGTIQKVSAQASLEYFNSRPYESRLGAWASAQSRPLPDRQTLEQRYAELKLQYPDANAVPLPETWGGYTVIPHRMEFWQGRPSRLHDRFEYTLRESQWQIMRLYP